MDFVDNGYIVYGIGVLLIYFLSFFGWIAFSLFTTLKAIILYYKAYSRSISGEVYSPTFSNYHPYSGWNLFIEEPEESRLWVTYMPYGMQILIAGLCWPFVIAYFPLKYLLIFIGSQISKLIRLADSQIKYFLLKRKSTLALTNPDKSLREAAEKALKKKAK